MSYPREKEDCFPWKGTISQKERLFFFPVSAFFGGYSLVFGKEYIHIYIYAYTHTRHVPLKKPRWKEFGWFHSIEENKFYQGFIFKSHHQGDYHRGDSQLTTSIPCREVQKDNRVLCLLGIWDKFFKKHRKHSPHLPKWASDFRNPLCQKHVFFLRVCQAYACLIWLVSGVDSQANRKLDPKSGETDGEASLTPPSYLTWLDGTSTMNESMYFLLNIGRFSSYSSHVR